MFQSLLFEKATEYYIPKTQAFYEDLLLVL